ncbi:phage tail family protein [Thermoactinomyces daqus]|uniref:Phage tail family protein n=1 Tax=Thermoactinomyces daqus TaxID=1329516 RepID=A0A7W1XA70_9BACL|nr:distal tail protein Dit [Thermoactinomyces daqus]MBA4542884.1 phage tail family protein [Thermoactinomyces daqus]
MFSFNGKHANVYFSKVLDVKRGMSAPRSPKLQSIPGKVGAYFFGVDTDVYEIECSVLIKGTDREDLWRKIRIANGWLLQDELKELVFDDEPELTYQAVCVKELDIDEILEFGIGTIRFIAPDAVAEGQTKEQRVGSASAQFSRTGIRYREDGTEVTDNYPVYKTGKFGQAILVEEGTANLLDSAANPTQEEVQVEIGQDYYLSVVDGLATIEHKRTETAPKTTIDKEGTDFSGSNDNSWNVGTLTGTAAASDGTNQYGVLQLAKSGTDKTFVDTTDSDWNAGTTNNITVYQTGTNSYITITLPSWDDLDGMNDLTQWNGASTAGAAVTTEGGTTFIRVTSSASAATGIDKRPAITFTNGFTIDFRARTTGTSSFYISDGTVGFIDNIPNTNNNWAWFRIAIANSSSGALYQNGTLVKNLTSQSYATRRILLGYQSAGTAGIIKDFDAVYYKIGANYGQPPANHIYTGDFYSREFDLSDVGLVNTFSSNSTASLESLYSGVSGTNDVKFQLGTNTGGTTTWSGTWSSTMPFTKGDDLTNKRLKYWVHLSMQDSGDAPCLYDQTISLTSGYKTSGTYESPAIDISQVKKASSTLQNWTAYGSQPAGTSISLQTRFSTDGGTTWSAYQDTTNGSSIPGITQTTDLSNARFQYKFTLSTSDVAVTPKLDKTTYSFTTGYKPSQTITIAGYPVGSIGTSANSSLEWSETKPSGTNVVFESSLDGTNWSTVTNGGTLFPAGSDLTGKTLYLRYTLSTSDNSKTPTLGSSITWFIQQQEPNKIKPATSTLRLTPTNVSRWQLEQKPYATGWNDTGTRNSEVLKVFAQEIVNDGKDTGTIDFFAYEEAENFKRYLIDADGTYGFSLFRNSDNQYEVWHNGSQQIVAASPSAGWHHVGITWNSSTLNLYLDGNLAGSASLISGINLTGTNYFYIGCTKSGTNQWNSLIDDLVVSQEFKDINYFVERANSTIPSQNSLTSKVYPFDESLVAIGDSTIVYNGTAETFPIFTITFAASTTNFKITNDSEYVQVTRNFAANDVLIVDCEKQLVTLNGASIMEYLDLDSDFFNVKSGDVIAIDPAGIATVDVSFVERWL